jgi:hypothetical protein
MGDCERNCRSSVPLRDIHRTTSSEAAPRGEGQQTFRSESSNIRDRVQPGNQPDTAIRPPANLPERDAIGITAPV